SDWARRGGTLTVKESPEAAQTESRTPEARPRAPSGKLSYKLKRELDLLPERIEALETGIEALQARIAEPDFYARPFAEVQPVLDELALREAELESAVERWAELESLQQG